MQETLVRSGVGRIPGEGNGNPHQYSCLGIPMDRGAWGATFQGVAKSWTRLSEEHVHFHSAPREESYDKHRRCIKKQRHHFADKVFIIKAMIFPVVMYGCESWTVNKAERQRTDAFKLWCWRRLLRLPWSTGRSHQTILKESNPEYSLRGMLLKLKFKYFGHLMQRANSLEKTLMLEMIKGKMRRGQKRKILR